jgi:transposase-like protein
VIEAVLDYALAVVDERIHVPVAKRCPHCQGENIVMCVESLLTQIYLCRDCRETFVVDKPPKSSS